MHLHALHVMCFVALMFISSSVSVIVEDIICTQWLKPSIYTVCAFKFKFFLSGYLYVTSAVQNVIKTLDLEMCCAQVIRNPQYPNNVPQRMFSVNSMKQWKNGVIWCKKKNVMKRPTPQIRQSEWGGLKQDETLPRGPFIRSTFPRVSGSDRKASRGRFCFKAQVSIQLNPLSFLASNGDKKAAASSSCKPTKASKTLVFGWLVSPGAFTPAASSLPV